MVAMGRVLVVVVVTALIGVGGERALAATGSPLKVSPITATFAPAEFATHYNVVASEPGTKLTYRWTLSLQLVDGNGAADPTQPGTKAAVDSGCNNRGVLTSTATSFVWHHGSTPADNCDHSKMGPSGHQGLVTVAVSDGKWTCTATYKGTNSGTGGAATCVQATQAAAYTCTGPQVKLLDSSNVYGVVNGGKPPSFLTRGKPYCLVSITTYHRNNGKGAPPGTLGLTSPSGNVGPFQAKASSGQGGAPNVNWYVDLPTAKPVVINGVYSCSDSDPATWSSNQQSHGTGFCIVVAVAAVKKGAQPAPAPAKKTAASYTCSGKQVKLFDSSNVYGVVNGAKPPTFTTKGKAFCLNSITTYHWNNGQGEAPGTLGLSGSSNVGPLQAKSSSGQGGAPNVNWYVNFTASPPTVINGSYSCVDSDPGTWSSNQQSAGKGFCIVYATPAVAKKAGTAPAKAKPKPKTKPKAAAKGKGGKGKLAIKASPDNGNPPLTVTFTLSSPKVVQWRVDFGDGQSKVAIGSPPATITHTYTHAGDYKPRLTVLATPTAPSAQSATTSITVGTSLMSFSAKPTSGNPPLSVTFTLGTSVKNITTWSVDFGDGQHTGGAGKPPASVTYTYAKPGTYAANFAVKPGAYAIVAAFAQVVVGGGTPPTLSLTASPTSGTHPLSMTFSLGSNIPGRVVSWQLIFGDGSQTSGSGRPPATVAHVYRKAGTFLAFLVVAQQQTHGGVQYIVPRNGLLISVR